MRHDPRIKAPRCPDHPHLHMVLKNGSHGLFWGCKMYPKCHNTHGAHPDGMPLGFPASSLVRKKRMDAHAKLNEIWEYEDKKQRKQMYDWLERNTRTGHIGKMDGGQIDDMLKKLAAYRLTIVKGCSATHPEQPNYSGTVRRRKLHRTVNGRMTLCNMLVDEIIGPTDISCFNDGRECKVCEQKLEKETVENSLDT